MRRLQTAVAALVLAAAALAVYVQTVRHQFVNFDDDAYVFANPMVKKGLTWEGLRWALTAAEPAMWHPITFMSHMADIGIFGLDPAGHHLSSVIIHALNVVLLLLVLRGLTGRLRLAVLAAALFAVHPLHVESVAWVSERKDVLSGFFLFLTLAAYRRWLRRRGIFPYLAVMLAYALGLAAKPMLVSAPLLLLLLDLWPLGRFAGAWRTGTGKGIGRKMASLAAEKAPLFLMAGAAAAIAFIVQYRAGAMINMARYPLAGRLNNAALSYVFYLYKAVWPTRLAIIYPLEAVAGVSWRALASIGVLAAVSFAVVLARSRRPWLLTGWCWYLTSLVPVIGLVQVGSQARADRYAYIPLLGIFLALAWESVRLAGCSRRHLAVTASCALTAVAAMAMAAWIQAGWWRDSETLMRRALDVTTGNGIAHNNLGIILLDRGKIDEAKEHFNLALEIDPHHANARYNLGLAHLRQEDFQAAARQLTMLVAQTPNDHDARNNLGLALLNLGYLQEAGDQFAAALELKPDLASAKVNMGIILSSRGKRREAEALFQASLEDDPSVLADVNYRQALLYLRQGQKAAATAHLQEALRLWPAHDKARLELGRILAENGGH